MELTQAQKKQYRTIGHKLKPVVTIADKGINEGVETELERALEDHELIKVKLPATDPATRKQLAAQLCETHKATLIQAIGRILLIYRPAKKPSPRLSNILRMQHEL
jgi:RNA-binding protein